MLLTAMAGTAPARAGQTCADAPPPVIRLAQGSRYTDDSITRSEIDPAGQAAATEALRPVDDFLRDLTKLANEVFDDKTDKQAIADCVVGQIAVWARAGALEDIGSETAALTIGSRLAGFGLVLLQVMPHTSRTEDMDVIRSWLAGLMRAQTRFWEEDAPGGARQGNLRAWAALGGSAAAAILDDPALRAWSAWSVSYVLCSAAKDGSLPQEMRRGRLALQYQLHAIAPLVVATLLLSRQGTDVQGECNHALRRVVDFAVKDVASGTNTAAITGVVQSFFDGSDKVEAFNVAWLEAYLLLDPAAESGSAGALAKAFRPLNYSKLGGKQAVIWAKP